MKTTTYKHSGNAGDIIYSIPFIRDSNLNTYKVFYLNINVPSTFTPKNHPVGEVMLNLKMAEMLRPLLLKVVDEVEIIENSKIEVDYDLDIFRETYFNLSSGNISLWNQIEYPQVRPNLIVKRLFVEPIENNFIIVNRTSRYNNLFIDYSFLKDYPNVYFVGVDSEFKQLKLHNPNIQNLIVKDFLEMAQYIAGCKLFIGNQSMAFAIAEQLKVKRVLEQYIKAPNVIPCGGEYYVFHTNEQLKSIFKNHLNNL